MILLGYVGQAFKINYHKLKFLLKNYLQNKYFYHINKIFNYTNLLKYNKLP
jgi:hypothetical protein